MLTPINSVICYHPLPNNVKNSKQGSVHSLMDSDYMMVYLSNRRSYCDFSVMTKGRIAKWD